MGKIKEAMLQWMTEEWVSPVDLTMHNNANEQFFRWLRKKEREKKNEST